MRYQIHPNCFGRSSLAVWILTFVAMLVPALTHAQNGPKAVPAERLTVHYQNGQFQLVTRFALMKVLPRSDVLPRAEGPVSGFWYELRSANGALRYRRIIANPLRLRFEGPDLEAGGTQPVLTESITQDQVFSVLIPQPQVGDQVVFFSSPLQIGGEAFPAQEIGRITFEPVIGAPRGAVRTRTSRGLPQPGPADGAVVSATKIVDNGPDTDRFVIVLLGDGYRASELTQFHNDAQDFVNFLFNTPPFSFNCTAFNVWRIDVSSTDSGADSPAPPVDNPMTPVDESLNCAGGTGTTVATYFDATFCADGVIHRLLGVNNGTATTVLNANVPQWDNALVIVNSTQYGGSGGSIGTTSLAGTWENIAIHELGHSAFGLADEYEYYAGCGTDAPGTRDNHPAAEPSQPNVTIETNPALIKWASLIAGGTAIPTTQNANCAVCDPQPDPAPGMTVVGLYEGAHYYHCDAYRPAFHCMMRNFGVFCPVCEQRILQTLEPFQPANTPPACAAGGPYVAECAGATTSVLLNGSASSDLDCDLLTFTWTGPFVGGMATGPTPTVQFSGSGNFVVQLQVSDGTANSVCNATVTIQDTTPPNIVCPTNIVRPNDPGLCSAVVTFSATAVDVCSGPLSVTCVPASGSVFPKGVTVVTCSTADPGGNDSQCSFSVTVQDKEAPVVACLKGVNPSGKNIPGSKRNSGQGQNPSGFYQLKATDNCDGTPALYIRDSASSFVAGPFKSGDTVKIVQTPGGKPRQQHAPGAVKAHIHLRGDALVFAADDDGNVSAPVDCLVPPRPK